MQRSACMPRACLPGMSLPAIISPSLAPAPWALQTRTTSGSTAALALSPLKPRRRSRWAGGREAARCPHSGVAAGLLRPPACLLLYAGVLCSMRPAASSSQPAAVTAAPPGWLPSCVQRVVAHGPHHIRGAIVAIDSAVPRQVRRSSYLCSCPACMLFWFVKRRWEVPAGHTARAAACCG